MLRRIVVCWSVMSALIAAFAVTPSVASAESQAGAFTVETMKVTTAAPDGSDGANTAACGVAVRRGAYTGYALCGTDILDVWYSNGIRETFVVGTTSRNNIYHIWQRYVGDTQWTGWRTLPGNGTAIDGIWPWASSPLIVYVVGTTGYLYCNRRGTSWSGWYLC